MDITTILDNIQSYNGSDILGGSLTGVTDLTLVVPLPVLQHLILVGDMLEQWKS